MADALRYGPRRGQHLFEPKRGSSWTARESTSLEPHVGARGLDPRWALPLEQQLPARPRTGGITSHSSVA
jgi:hypothetical protein